MKASIKNSYGLRCMPDDVNGKAELRRQQDERLGRGQREMTKEEAYARLGAILLPVFARIEAKEKAQAEAQETPS